MTVHIILLYDSILNNFQNVFKSKTSKLFLITIYTKIKCQTKYKFCKYLKQQDYISFQVYLQITLKNNLSQFLN